MPSPRLETITCIPIWDDGDVVYYPATDYLSNPVPGTFIIKDHRILTYLESLTKENKQNAHSSKL